MEYQVDETEKEALTWNHQDRKGGGLRSQGTRERRGLRVQKSKRRNLFKLGRLT